MPPLQVVHVHTLLTTMPQAFCCDVEVLEPHIMVMLMMTILLL